MTPTATPELPTPTITPSSTPTRTATRAPTSTRTITRTLVPRLTPTITATVLPRDIELKNLNAEEERMMRDGIQLLKSCAPATYSYVRSHVRQVTRGTPVPGLPNASAYVSRGEPIVYLPDDGAINNPKRYQDSVRTFVAAILLAHEARHIELGRATTEPDAYAFTLPLFEPCKPNDIGPAICYSDTLCTNSYAAFRRYTEWRASLPYPGEPTPTRRP